MIVFSASWCGPCRVYKGIYEQFLAANGNVQIERIDIDSNKKLTEQYNVRSVPSTVFLRNGVEIGQISGVVQRRELEKIFS